MSSLGIIAIVCVAFIFGAICGVIMISMCMSNDRYDDSEAMYELGRAEMRREVEDLCSHCCYKVEGVTFEDAEQQ